MMKLFPSKASKMKSHFEEKKLLFKELFIEEKQGCLLSGRTARKEIPYQ